MHTACVQKLSLKTSRRDFWNFVTQQSRPSAMPQAPPIWTHHPTLQDLVFLSVYLKSAVFLFHHSENSQPYQLSDLLYPELQREA